MNYPGESYIKEGWGLAAQDREDGSKVLWVTDGSHVLKSIDLSTWKADKQLEIFQENGEPYSFINELEIIKESPSSPAGVSQYAFGNVFLKNHIIMIDLRSGKVVTQWNFDQLVHDQKAMAKNTKDELRTNNTIQEFNKLKKNAESITRRGWNMDVGNYANSKDPQAIFNHYWFWEEGKFVLNGIAYDSKDDTFVLTGKAWDTIHKVKLDYHKYVESPNKQGNNDFYQV